MRAEIERVQLDIEEEDLQDLLKTARRLRKREKQGTWSLKEEEEEKVKQRLAELEKTGRTEGRSADVSKMSGVKIKRAGLRAINRDRLKARLAPSG